MIAIPDCCIPYPGDRIWSCPECINGNKPCIDDVVWAKGQRFIVNNHEFCIKNDDFRI